MQMKKDVLVTVRGLQLTPDGDDTIEVVTAGKYYEKDGRRYVFYEELGEDDSSVVKNTVQIDPDHVEVRKRGMINTAMGFEKNTKLLSLYETPYGQMELGIFTRDIVLEQQEDRLRLALDYRLEMNHEHISDSKIEILVESSPQ